jgi:hypothetical protein
VNKNMDENSQIQVGRDGPKIAGNFSEWKIEDMMKIDKFFDCLLRNKMPSVRQYVEDKPDYVSKMSMIMNRDVHILFRNKKRFGPHCQKTHLAMVEIKMIKESTLKVGCQPKRKKSSKLRVNGELSMVEKSYTSVIKKTRMFSNIRISQEKEFSQKRVALYRTEDLGVVYTDELEKTMCKDNPFFINPMNTLIDEHIQLELISKNISDLSNYYAFATFMPPGENKIILSYEDILDEENYNLCDTVVPIRRKEVSGK